MPFAAAPSRAPALRRSARSGKRSSGACHAGYRARLDIPSIGDSRSNAVSTGSPKTNSFRRDRAV